VPTSQESAACDWATEICSVSQQASIGRPHSKPTRQTRSSENLESEAQRIDWCGGRFSPNFLGDSSTAAVIVYCVHCRGPFRGMQDCTSRGIVRTIERAVGRYSRVQGVHVAEGAGRLASFVKTRRVGQATVLHRTTESRHVLESNIRA
jgi:hypothetical protein